MSHRLLLSAGAFLAAAFVLAGCADTSTAAGPPGPKSAGNVGFTDYTDNDGPESTVILTGAIGDFGKAVSVNPDGSPNPDHSSELSLQLRQGSFRVSVAAVEKQFVQVMETFPADRKTCSGTEQVSGAVPVVAGSGTGAYKGISGSFDVSVSLAEVDQLNGCGGLLKQLLVITGSGTVTGY